MSAPSHLDTIVEQFTRQAVVFSTSPTIADERALRLLVEWSEGEKIHRAYPIAVLVSDNL